MPIRKNLPRKLFLTLTTVLLIFTYPVLFARGVSESEARAELDSANTDLTTATRQYHTLAAEVDRVDNRIAEVEQEIAVLDQESAKTNQALNGRMRAIYKYSDFSAVELILGSNNINDFTDRLALLSRLAYSDNRLMKTAAENKAVLEKKRGELDAEKENRLAALTDLTAQTRDIEVRIREKQDVLSAAQTSAQAPDQTAVQPAEPGHPDRPLSGHSEVGGATYYSYTGGYTCAHPYLPMGTLLRVTNLANGAQVWVEVADRGPFGGAIIDLEEPAFAKIADIGQGVITVRVEW